METREEHYASMMQAVQRYAPSADLEEIQKAYEYADRKHKNQLRKSGEPYIIHPLCVAIILADLELDKETIVAGLLHDIGKCRLSSYLYGNAQIELNVEKMKYVRTHSRLSYDILKERGYEEPILEDTPKRDPFATSQFSAKTIRGEYDSRFGDLHFGQKNNNAKDE